MESNRNRLAIASTYLAIEQLIYFIVSDNLAFDCARPYLTEAVSSNRDCAIIVPRHVDIQDIRLFRGKLEIIEIDTTKHKFRMFVFHFLLLLFTKKDYSSRYTGIRERRLNRLGIFGKFLGLVNPLVAVESTKVNSLLTYLNTLFFPRLSYPFSQKGNKNDEHHLIAFSVPFCRYLLSNSNLNITSVVESWDHVTKEPLGFSSWQVVHWSERLKFDWFDYQGKPQNNFVYPPVKLWYAQNRGVRQIPRKKDYMMYAFMSTPMSRSGLFEEEVKFVKLLVSALRSHNIVILLKPKPNSQTSDLMHFATDKNVIIGEINAQKSGTDYQLSEQYNKRRLVELGKASLVINIGTTFALDAAAYGAPVLQLKISHHDFPVISNLGDHNRFINQHSNFVKHIRSTEQIVNSLNSIFRDENLMQDCIQHTEFLKKTFIGSVNDKMSFKNLFNCISAKATPSG